VGSDKGDRALEGRWRRTTEPDVSRVVVDTTFGHDPRMFPGEIEFTGTRYAARKAPGQGFIVWDVGTFTLAGDVLTMTLANDATASYSVEVDRDDLTITGEIDYPIRYHRIG
jgi:hypothetical protein